ncbi:exodeoxyribonuclease VII large subunit [Glutamicibacter sp. BSL13]
MDSTRWQYQDRQTSSLQEQRRKVAQAVSSVGRAEFTGEVVGKVSTYGSTSYLTLRDEKTDIRLKAHSSLLPAGTAEGSVLQVNARPEYDPSQRIPEWIVGSNESQETNRIPVRKISAKGPIARYRESVSRHFNLPAKPNTKISLSGINQEVLRIRLLCGYHSQVLDDFRNAVGVAADTRIEIVQEVTGVQGDHAIDRIAKAISSENNRTSSEAADMIVILRGGGFDSDFLIFDDAQMIDAIAKSKIPVATAIGHSQHVPLAALAAAVSFDTPSTAGKEIRSFNFRQARKDRPSYPDLVSDNERLTKTVRRLEELNRIDKNSLAEKDGMLERITAREQELSLQLQRSHDALDIFSTQVFSKTQDSALDTVRLKAVKNGLWWTLWTVLLASAAVLGSPLTTMEVMWLSAAPAGWAMFTFSGGARAAKWLRIHQAQMHTAQGRDRAIRLLSRATAPRHIRRALRNR